MDNRDRKVLEKIYEHCESIIENTKQFKNAEAFKNSKNINKIALFDLLQIGELAKDGLTQTTLNTIKEVQWANMYGLRNRIVHGYASVDYIIIWNTIKNDIPKLKTTIRKYL